ncbi:MAG: hypothetical protein M0R22_00950 [Dehalococcoidia bacterium]|nr:hypothetical protein [Dehalococcoidia bacterium]
MLSILRREFGDERNEGGLAKLCAEQEKVNERNAALEEAARTLRALYVVAAGKGHTGEMSGLRLGEDAIRALKEEP